MYFVPEGTEICGYYECEECHNRFLDTGTGPRMICPYCGEEPDMEIGPDDLMPEPEEHALLVEIIRGKEEIEKYDQLLSLAITGGNFDWI